MKQAARIQTTIEILEKIAAASIPMDNTIRDYMAGRRYIGSKDRAAIVERVYRIVRAQARLGWWLERAKHPEDTPRSRVIADLALHGEDATNLFPGGKHMPTPLSKTEKDLIAALRGQDLTHSDMPGAVRVECPSWAEDKLRDLFGEAFEAQMQAMLEPAALDLRVNTLKGSVDKAKDMLAAQGVETDKTPYAPNGLRVKGKAFMSATKAFSKGLVEIQDEGSQLISLLCGARDGMRVLDYCAGAGGKTLAIAAAMENKGNIVAMDIDPRRLEKGSKRYKKAGVHNVELRSLAQEKNRKWLRRQKGVMDVVLVDAPCSSSGTWRRNPDLRWRWYGPGLEDIRALQRDILAKVAGKVKPGGKLVYATCSLFREENEDQVAWFLQQNPDFAVFPLEQAWEDAKKEDRTDTRKGVDFARNPPCQGPFLRLTPEDHGTDGFFAALLQKK